jgi:hypothetical protein
VKDIERDILREREICVYIYREREIDRYREICIYI